MSTSAASAPSPQIVFDTLNAYQRTAALKTGIELDIFTAIGKQGASAAEIAKKSAAAERGIRILCDSLTIFGLLTKQGSTYRLTPDSGTFLDKASPAYMGTIAQFLNSEMLMACAAKLTDSVRKGGSAVEHPSTDPEHPMWVEFAHTMAPMMMMPAEMIAGILGAERGEKWRVLDVAAGHGVFGLTIARKNRNAEITALDWPAVLQVAEGNAEKFGAKDRFRKQPGSAFDVDFGKDYDVVLFTNFLHHFDVPTCELLTRKAHAALKPGGKLAILEFIPNDDRVSPPQATFSLMMLLSTPSGDAYTFAELQSMCKNSGFTTVERHDLVPTPESLVIATR